MKKLVLITGAFVLSIGWASAQSLTKSKPAEAAVPAVKIEKVATYAIDPKTGRKINPETAKVLPALQSLVDYEKVKSAKKAAKNKNNHF